MGKKRQGPKIKKGMYNTFIMIQISDNKAYRNNSKICNKIFLFCCNIAVTKNRLMAKKDFF